jgi:hypothetical protein
VEGGAENNRPAPRVRAGMGPRTPPLLLAAALALAACQQWDPATPEPIVAGRFELPETLADPRPPGDADLSVACQANANLLWVSIGRGAEPASWWQRLVTGPEPLPPEAEEAHRACLASLDVPRVIWDAGAAGRR